MSDAGSPKVVVSCPNCGHEYRVAAELVGRNGKCRSCESTFVMQEVELDLYQFAEDPPELPAAASSGPRTDDSEAVEAAAKLGGMSAIGHLANDDGAEAGPFFSLVGSLPLRLITNATAIVLVILFLVRVAIYFQVQSDTERLAELDTQIVEARSEVEALSWTGSGARVADSGHFAPQPAFEQMWDARPQLDPLRTAETRLERLEYLRSDTDHYNNLVSTRSMDRGLLYTGLFLFAVLGLRGWVYQKTAALSLRAPFRAVSPADANT